MVSPFTLGLFAPLPLAMMIPFMATQSLAMGEAFGKSFQFGKRKISSMSNEEFNKLTIQQIMNEQTANIRSLIPMLSQQMTDSNKMQEKVFQEMTKLIPAFIKGLGAGTQDIVDNDLPALLTPSPGSILDRIQKVQIDINVKNATSGLQGPTDIWGAAFAAPPTTSAVTSDFTKQSGYGITENLPKTTDSPITLTSLTDAQIKDAYSDMLSNRNNLSAKNKQLLTLEYKKRFSTTLKADRTATQNAINLAEARTGTDAEHEYITWNKNLTTMAIALQELSSRVRSFFDNNGQSAMPVHAQPHYKILQNRVNEARKKMASHLQQSRNSSNHHIKSVANKYYQQKFWLKF